MGNCHRQNEKEEETHLLEKGKWKVASLTGSEEKPMLALSASTIPLHTFLKILIVKSVSRQKALVLNVGQSLKADWTLCLALKVGGLNHRGSRCSE